MLKFACALGYHEALRLWLEKTADGPYILSSSDRLQNNNDLRSVGNASKKSASWIPTVDGCWTWMNVGTTGRLLVDACWMRRDYHPAMCGRIDAGPYADTRKKEWVVRQSTLTGILAERMVNTRSQPHVTSETTCYHKRMQLCSPKPSERRCLKYSSTHSK